MFFKIALNHFPFNQPFTTTVQNKRATISLSKLPELLFTYIEVESYLRSALIRFNPCIAENPAHADTVIYKLRALISTVRPHDLVTQNERFKKLIFEENSFPFDKDGRSISIRFFDYDNPENNHFVVTNQWVYPQKVGGKRLDVVLLINGFPVAIGEMKSPVRPAISWMDGAGDILNYEKSIPEMFVTNIFNFATEGKGFRYGAINAPVTLWGPWYADIPHEEGDFSKVQKSVASITRQEVILDLFRCFTLFSTDKHIIVSPGSSQVSISDSPRRPGDTGSRAFLPEYCHGIASRHGCGRKSPARPRIPPPFS